MLSFDEIRQKPQAVLAAKLTLCAVFSCLVASAELGGIRVPLPAALASALPPIYALVVLAGSLFTYFLHGGIAHAPLLICSLVLTVLARWVLGERNHPSVSAAIAGAGMLISTVMFAFAGLVRGTDWLFWGIGTAVAAVLAYCAAKVRACLDFGFPLRLHGSDAFFCAICYIAIAAALCSARIFTVSFGEILLAFVTLTAAKRYRALGGMLCGSLSACALILYDGQTAGLAVLLGAAGGAAGGFAAQNKGVVFAVYQFVCGIGMLLAERSNAAALAWIGSVIGGMLFLLLPVTQIADFLLEWADNDTDMAAFAGARMDYLSAAIADVRGSAERIANMLERTEPLYQPADRVTKLVCVHCENHAACWKEDEAETAACFQEMAEANWSAELAPPEECLEPERISEEFRRVKRQNAAARSDAARLRDTQTLLFSQMQVSEMVLRQSSKHIQRQYHREQGHYITGLLERFGLSVLGAAVQVSPARRTMIELYLREMEDLETATVTDYLEEMLQIPLMCTESATIDSTRKIVLQSGGIYQVETAAAQCAVHEDEPCGDAFDSFFDGDGCRYLVLSDGMGTGRHAAVDAKIVLRSFRTLVQSGMDCEDAAKTVNAIMLTKSGEERFATLDVAKIDTETAAVTLYKYGAGPTLIKHGDRVTLCQAATNPIGIVHSAEPYTTVFTLSDGDFLFLLSDGLDDSLYPFLREQLLAGGQNLQALAHAVCAKAQRDAGGAPQDDVTVLGAQITQNSDFGQASGFWQIH